MEFRQLGNTGLRTGVVGIGADHLNPLPQADAIRILDAAIAGGVNYFDLLGWTTNTKEAFGEAFRGHRDHLVLAGHLGMGEENGQYWKTTDPATAENLINDLLRKLHTDHLDIAHLSNVDGDKALKENMREDGLLGLARKLKEQGKIRFIGFSGHDPETSKKAVLTGSLDVIMQPINIMGADEPARRKVLSLCASRGVGVVAMKVFVGGVVFEKHLPVTPVQCISYTLSQPGLATCAIGVKSVAEVAGALRYVEATPAEKAFEAALPLLDKKVAGSCVYCSHCLPCPSVVDIPQVNRLLAAARHGLTDSLRQAYESAPVKASACVECGICVERCPFGVDVVANVKEAANLFEKA